MRIALLFVAACADDAVVCGDNTTLTDGVCVAEPAPEPEPPTLESVLAELFPCTPAEGDGRIDVADGCVDDVCLGARTPADADCSQPVPEVPTIWTCTWQPGVQTLFFGETDPRRGLAIGSISISDPYPGTTAGGLGPGVDFGCFVDELGMPEVFNLQQTKKSWLVVYAQWPGISVSDGDFMTEPDGTIDELTLERQSGGS